MKRINVNEEQGVTTVSLPIVNSTKVLELELGYLSGQPVIQTFVVDYDLGTEDEARLEDFQAVRRSR